MSSHSYYQPTGAPHHPAHGRHHPHQHPGQTATSVSRHSHRGHSDYTLVHAGKQVRIGPVAFWIAVGFLVVMGVWTIATGTYFTFRENVLTRLISRQAEIQFAYEDRIADLRAQVDRVTSRQLLDQEQFEQKLDGLVKRQSVLEQRASALGGDHAAPARSQRAPARAPSLKPSPINDTVIFSAPPDREARLQSRGLPESNTRLAATGGAGGLNGVLARVALSLDRVEHRQSASLNAIEETTEGKARRMQGVLADLGVDLGKHGGDITGAIGGPFVPAKPPSAAASAFDRQIYRINLAKAQVARYTSLFSAVPVRKPIEGDVDMSSPFGMRMDPFLGGAAIHTGIDLRGDTGDPVHVTASGTVTIASWQGGYGNMIEVDHHNGLATRYGHLSKIEVKVGQNVEIGQVIGRIGSTGRSTGPHLHYETRVAGTAVDPQKFMRAGIRLGAF